MNVLVDTSVWVRHFRHHDSTLSDLLLQNRVLSHPMVLGELACGAPPAPRKQTLSDIGTLQSARQATWDEIMAFIERERLYGLGCGLVDIALLTATLITPSTGLWTLDKRLARLALRFDVSF